MFKRCYKNSAFNYCTDSNLVKNEDEKALIIFQPPWAVIAALAGGSMPFISHADVVASLRGPT